MTSLKRVSSSENNTIYNCTINRKELVMQLKTKRLPPLLGQALHDPAYAQ